MKSWEFLFHNQDLVDIILVVGNNKVKFEAHRLVLAAHSDVMKNMLYGQMKESLQDTIELPAVDETAFRALLEYFYTGKLPVDKSFICQLIELCDFLSILDIKQHCCTWLYKNIETENVCQYLMFSTRLSANEQLYKYCFEWIEDHAAAVLCTDGFVEHVTTEELQKIAASDNLNLDEIRLFEGIKRWIEHDPSRHNDGKQTAKFLRLPMINAYELLGCVRGSNFVQSDAILNALASQQYSLDNPYDIDSPHLTLRLPSTRLVNGVSSFKWKTALDVPSDDLVSFKTCNHAVIQSSAKLVTAVAVPIPCCVRVQLVTKSTVNRQAKVEIVIIPPNSNIRAPTYCSYAPTYRVEIDEDNLNMFSKMKSVSSSEESDEDSLDTSPKMKSASIRVGCIAGLKFHITSTHVCLQVNGVVQSRVGLSYLQCSKYVPNDHITSGLCEKSDHHRVFVTAEISKLQEAGTIAVKEEAASCCDQ